MLILTLVWIAVDEDCVMFFRARCDERINQRQTRAHRLL